MNIEQIILFYHIATEKNISNAAKLCHLSQPAATKQIQRLEESLGLSLLIRSNRGIELTVAGESFYEYCTHFIELHSYMIDEMKELKYQRETFQIAAVPVMAHYIIPCRLCKLKESYPSLTFNLQSMNSQLVEDRLLANSIDVGFVMNAEPNAAFDSYPIFEDTLVLAACHKFDIPDKITIDEIENYLLVIMGEEYTSYKMIDNFFKERGKNIESFSRLQKFESLEGIKSLVQNCCGISIICRKAIENEIAQGVIKVVQLDGFELNYNVSAIINKNHDLAPHFDKIVQAMICSC